jgi:hypothetical protein
MKKERLPLDIYDIPDDMKKYLKHYGYHFNHKLYKFAVSKMYKKNKDGKEDKIQPIEKEKVDEMLKKHNIILENNEMYDATYLYSMAQSDFMGNAFDEVTTMKWIKSSIDDVDKPIGYIFNRFYADMCFMGIPIDWEEYV